jgi:hypothetical protein
VIANPVVPEDSDELDGSFAPVAIGRRDLVAIDQDEVLRDEESWDMWVGDVIEARTTDSKAAPMLIRSPG